MSLLKAITFTVREDSQKKHHILLKIFTFSLVIIGIIASAINTGHVTTVTAIVIFLFIPRLWRALEEGGNGFINTI